MKKNFWLILLTSLFVALLLTPTSAFEYPKGEQFWQIQSIDTMKQSRDLAREKLNDPTFDQEIETQVKNIAATGANYVTIDTPYDDKFLPFLKRWVMTARKYELSVWFRGNFSLWEGWFGYPKEMSFDEHTQGVIQFIQKNPDLFADGDIFSSCPECENGAQGDPRQTKKVEEYRQFMISETNQSHQAFVQIGKDVKTNFWSMNKDVADLVMDHKTTKKLGGVVVVDHYVRNPKQLAADLEELSKKSGGTVALGEFGAPIADITDSLTEAQKASWIKEALSGLRDNSNVLGVNYWVNKGGSTALWDSQNLPNQSVEIITTYYSPELLELQVKNELRQPISAVAVNINGQPKAFSSSNFTLPVLLGDEVQIYAQDYQSYKFKVTEQIRQNHSINLILKHQNSSFWFRFLVWFSSITHSDKQ